MICMAKGIGLAQWAFYLSHIDESDGEGRKGFTFPSPVLFGYSR